MWDTPHGVRGPPIMVATRFFCSPTCFGAKLGFKMKMLIFAMLILAPRVPSLSKNAQDVRDMLFAHSEPRSEGVMGVAVMLRPPPTTDPSKQQTIEPGHAWLHIRRHPWPQRLLNPLTQQEDEDTWWIEDPSNATTQYHFGVHNNKNQKPQHTRY